jgi:hypothetical protein
VVDDITVAAPPSMPRWTFPLQFRTPVILITTPSPRTVRQPMTCPPFVRTTVCAVLLLSAVSPSLSPAGAQAAAQAAPPQDSVARSPAPPHYWRDFAAGFAASLLAHESAHVVTSLAVGGPPSFGFDKGRPTVYSGIDARREPHKQFLFSSMGLNVQAALDEGILDVPHHRGAPFERGVLASGIATALFYITIGRTASVSDVDYMARTSSLTKTDISLIYGGVAALHTLRVSRDGHYANFFVRPAATGQKGMRVGVRIEPDADLDCRCPGATPR